MRNPLENEETAFRFVLGTIAYLAPIVVASWIATWLGVIVFFVASGVVVVLIRRGTQSPPTGPPSGRAQVEDTPAMEGTNVMEDTPVIEDTPVEPDDRR